MHRWCPSCLECQLVNQQAIRKESLRPLPLIVVPFERIGMDLIRSFHQSACGFHSVLVLVDYAMPYTKAVPFHTISAKTVAQVLFQVISQVALLKEMLTDQGMSFMCHTLKELCKLLGIKSIQTSFYHLQTDRLVIR